MIKRSFIGLTAPKLKCDMVEPDPKDPEAIPIPPRMILLLNEPLDSIRESLIKQGDRVQKGERIFLYKDSQSYVTSPVSGAITAIAPITGNYGVDATYLVLETNTKQDVEQSFAELAATPNIENADRYLRGIPGDPPLKQLADPENRFNRIVITGVDDDLMCTTRQYVLARFADKIDRAVALLKQITGINDISIAMTETMAKLPVFNGMNLVRVASDYISSLPPMIMAKHLGIPFVPGKDLDVCFIPVEAAMSLVRAYEEKQSVYDKVITIIDKTGKRTRVTATIGTPIHRIFTRIGVETAEQDRIIIGGPLRGIAAYTLYHPVMPDMDTLIVQASGESPMASDYPCINCGKCVKICPSKVPVNLLVRYLEAGLYQEAADSCDLLSCIDCGLCSYVCTAKIPIFQYIRLGKHELMKMESEIQTEAQNV
ncbi:RnfC2 [uncultured Desulfobacterium sp.]|uniref:RnfC2 n=1 Tax=uncultured Desulfobacterium sp. TaxID=201089 RepID=A0A445MS29_9BACT|nr:RnfC2 [uncultured Desulfobacterium sp.]